MHSQAPSRVSTCGTCQPLRKRHTSPVQDPMSRRAQGRAAHGPDAEAAAAAPRKAILRTPSRVANVWMPNRLSPSTSARSFVIAMTVANTVTKHVMNLRARQRALMQFGHAHRIGVWIGACQEQLL